MKIKGKLKIAAVCLMGALGASTGLLFKMGFVRSKSSAKEEGGWWVKYGDQVRRGRAWFISQKPKEVYIESYDKLILCGYFLPAQNPKGTVLLMHGYRSENFNDFSCVLPFYHSLGYNILCADQRSHGKSEGKLITFGVKERYDCRSWILYLNSKLGENLPIFLGGISMGASTVLMAAGLKLPQNVKGVIADCSFTSPWDITRRVLREKMHLPAFPFLYLADFICHFTAGFGLKDASTVEAMEVNERIPVLFIHGSEDEFVPPYMTKKAFAACKAEKKMVLVRGAEHAESYMVDTSRYQSELTEFLAKYS